MPPTRNDNDVTNPKFQLGQVVATPGCLAALMEAGQTVDEFLVRHQNGDWGEVCPEDAACNNTALVDGSRILSAYRLRTVTEIWIISEAAGEDGKRGSTCLLRPAEY
jgi:hypothetical protein